MKVHLIRHGTTTSSGKTFAGRADVPLTAEGRDMAQDLARRLSAEPICRIFASPLSRAVDTARPLADALGLAVQKDPLLLEFDFGAFEGRPKTALDKPLRKAHATLPVPGGEALIDVWDRAGRFLETIGAAGKTDASAVAVIGHFWTNRMIYGWLRGWDFETACRSRKYRPATGELVSLSYRNGARFPHDPARRLAGKDDPRGPAEPSAAPQGHFPQNPPPG